MRNQRSFARWLDDPKVSLPVAALAFALFFVLLFLLGASVPPEKPKVTPPNPFADPRAGAAHIEQLARTYGDNFDRLTEDDRTFLNAIAMGHGRELLSKTVRELSTKGKSGTTAP